MDYSLKVNTLIYKHTAASHKRALAFQESGKHAYFYPSTAPFAQMTPSKVRPLDAVCLPYYGKTDKTPLSGSARILLNFCRGARCGERP